MRNETLPQPITPMDKLPELVGTYNQIQQAMEIRKKIMKSLQSQIKLEMPDGRPNSESMLGEMTSTEKMINHSIGAYQQKAEQYKRFKEIMSNGDAIFWINNQTNQKANYMNSKLNNYVVKLGKLEGIKM